MGAHRKGRINVDPNPGLPDTGNDLVKKGKKEGRSWFAKDLAMILPWLSFTEVAGDDKGVKQGSTGGRGAG